jgi:hypothetical protein
MPCGQFAVGPSRQPILPDAIQPMLRLSAAGVSAIPQLHFYRFDSIYRHMFLVIHVKVWRMVRGLNLDEHSNDDSEEAT